MTMSVRAVGLVVALLGIGCSKQSAETTANPAPAPAGTTASVRRSANVITAAELQNTTARNLRDAVQQLRPQWLRSRGVTSMGGTARTGGQGAALAVYLDNTRFGGVESLQNLSPQGVIELRYLDAGEATSRFGTGHTMGAIVIKQTRQ